MDKSNKKEILRWLKRKFIRLMPLFYMAMLLYVVCLQGERKHVQLGNVVMHILFLHGMIPHYANSILGVEWYLGVMAIFYVTFPLLSAFTSSLEKSITLFILCSFGCNVIVYFLLYVFGSYNEFCANYFGVFFFLGYVPVWLLGIILYHLFNSDFLNKLRYRKDVSFVILSISVMMLIGQSIEKNSLFGIAPCTMFGIWFFLMIISMYIQSPQITNNSVLRYLGKNSYFLYLFHMIILKFVNTIFGEYGSSSWISVLNYFLTVLIGIIITLILGKGQKILGKLCFTFRRNC